MEAVRFTACTKVLELQNVPIPKIEKPTEVLVKVAFAGICGTDLHIVEGEFPCNPHRTVTLGHEFCGTIEEVGSEVTIFKKGDRVVVDPNSGCHCCHFCHSGNPHFCKVGGLNNTLGIYRDGAWAEYTLCPVEQVHMVPDEITLEQAALTEPVSCLAHGWDLISPITVGVEVLILGAGIIGNLCVCALHLQGHRRVTVSEPNPIRLDLMKKLNTGYKFITPEQLKKNQAADPEYLFDIIIDCSGFSPAIEHAVTLLQSGGKLSIFGVAPPQDRISVSPFDIFRKELKIYGIMVNPFSFPKSLGLLCAFGERYLDYANLGIKTFKLSEYKEAIELLKKGSIAKAMFVF